MTWKGNDLPEDELITRRAWLYEETVHHLLALKGGASFVDVMGVKEAIASTAIEHPEWDMDEVKTRKEWNDVEASTE